MVGAGWGLAWGLALMRRDRRRGIVGYTAESSASPRRRGPGGSRSKGESNDQVTHPAEGTEPSADAAGPAGRRRSRGGPGGVQLVRHVLHRRQHQHPTGTSSPAAATAGSLKTATIGSATVLTNAQGFTLYSFAPDTPTTSNCNGTCAQNWPPVKGPVTASGVSGTFGTIKRSDGSVQATFDGHPLYAFVGDTAPGQAKGNGLNAAGGLWHEVTTSGTAAAGSSSSGSGGGGSGY